MTVELKRAGVKTEPAFFADAKDGRHLGDKARRANRDMVGESKALASSHCCQ